MGLKRRRFIDINLEPGAITIDNLQEAMEKERIEVNSDICIDKIGERIKGVVELSEILKEFQKEKVVEKNPKAKHSENNYFKNTHNIKNRINTQGIILDVSFYF